MATPYEPTVDQLQQWLTDAIAAKQSFATGAKTVEVAYMGRKITYSSTRTSLADLDTHISQLKEQIRTYGCTRRRRSGRVRF